MTPVEWLENMIVKMEAHGGDLGEDLPALMQHIEQAKEMEKQQERMYSEEEVIELLHKRMRHTLGNDYQETTTEKWFEQFKKNN